MVERRVRGRTAVPIRFSRRALCALEPVSSLFQSPLQRRQPPGYPRAPENNALGPWTNTENIFDSTAAYGHYIHIAGAHDGLSDPGREGGWRRLRPVHDCALRTAQHRRLQYGVLQSGIRTTQCSCRRRSSHANERTIPDGTGAVSTRNIHELP